MELARNLKIESVSRLQPTRPLTLDLNSPVSAAVGMMRENRVGCLLITDAKKLAGIFTERDLLRRVIAAGQSLDTPVGTVMTLNPVTVTAQDPIRNAIQKMEAGSYRHLPVVDGTGRPVGVLSVKRIVHYLVEHFPRTIYTLPPEPNAFPQEAEGA
jgi:CBS domain-containing protein